MRVLVTGGKGYIGSHMTWMLVEAGHTVVVVDDLSTVSAPATLPHEVEGVLLDVLRTDQLAIVMKTRKIEAVIHFAGRIKADESTDHPVLYWHQNVDGTRSVVEAMQRAGVDKLVFSSSAAVYGLQDSARVSETAPCQPRNPYGKTKLAAEQLIMDACFTRICPIAAVALRYFNVAGADPNGRVGQNGRLDNLMQSALRAALENKVFTVHGVDWSSGTDGSAVRDFVHVWDLCKAHLKALRYVENGFIAFNVGSGSGYSVFEVLNEVKQVTGVNFPVEHGPRRPGDIGYSVADTSSILRALRWERSLRLRDMVQSAYEWEKICQQRSRS